MKTLPKYCMFFLLVIICHTANAQYTDYGQDPARVKWSVIKTEHYRVIYPQTNYIQANLYANILETVYPHVRNTMQSKRKSVVPVILHAYNSQSNGMVAWAPKRMELLPVPDRNDFQIPEFSLSVHESRHVAQMDRLNQGVFRPFHFILGEHVMGVSAGIVPQWLLEGDAVVTETALSSSGRGRRASFMMPYRAQIATGKNYSLDKWFLGSYKDYTYDFYALGYGMASYARVKYGADVWDKVLNKMTYIPVPPFARSLKKVTGLTPKKLFDAAFIAFQNEWKAITPENPDKPMVISPVNNTYTEYLYPQEINGGIVVLKKGMKDISSIVIVDTIGKETRLAYVGAVNSKLTAYGNYIYWTEHIPGLRWQHENYSVVKRLDINTKKVKTITKRSRYFNIAVVDNYSLAVSENYVNGNNSISIINMQGKKTASYPVLHNLPVQDIIADYTGNIFASLIGSGNGIFKFNIHTKKWEGLLAYQRTNIESLRLSGNKLLFESGYNGVNNIYSLDTAILTVKRLTNAQFGSFNGIMSTDGKKLIFSDYSAKGYSVASVNTNELNEERVRFKDVYKFKFAEELSEQESFNIDTTNLDVVKYDSKPYRRGLHLFNVHSWLPVFADVDEVARTSDLDFEAFKSGVTFLSQNRLNTMTTQASYYYDFKEHRNHGFLSLTYSGWYPVFQLRADYGGMRRIAADRISENRLTAELSMYIPLNFSNNHYMHGLQPFATYKYTNDVLGIQDYQYLNAGIYYYQYRNMARRDIFPKFGYQFWLRYVGQPYIDMGQLYIARGNLYLPGILSNHGLRLSGSFLYQSIKAGEYFFPESFVDVSRENYYYIGTEKLYTIKGDYSFPIAYPDWSIGSFVYLSRIRGNIFYDYTNSSVLHQSNTQQYWDWIPQTSYGADITFDMHFLRLRYAPATLMFRFVKPEDRNLRLNVALGFNIN